MSGLENYRGISRFLTAEESKEVENGSLNVA